MFSLQHENQISKDREFHQTLMAIRKRVKDEKHYSICHDIVSKIIDLTTTIAEYRELTNKYNEYNDIVFVILRSKHACPYCTAKHFTLLNCGR